MITAHLLVLAAAALPFNLVCTGTEVSGVDQPGHFGLENETKKPFTDVLRVDLRTARWCREDCNMTEQILETSDTRIRFELVREPIETITEVSRESGLYVYRQRAGHFILMRSGQCEKAPFSGFPARRF